MQVISEFSTDHFWGTKPTHYPRCLPADSNEQRFTPYTVISLQPLAGALSDAVTAPRLALDQLIGVRILAEQPHSGASDSCGPEMGRLTAWVGSHTPAAADLADV